MISSNNLVVTCIQENADGSADVEVEVGSEMKSKLIGDGINFMLIKGILEGTTEDVFRWAELGKQQEKTDRLVDRFNEIYSEDTK
jgi:hypothetical protein